MDYQWKKRSQRALGSDNGKLNTGVGVERGGGPQHTESTTPVCKVLYCVDIFANWTSKPPMRKLSLYLHYLLSASCGYALAFIIEKKKSHLARCEDGLLFGVRAELRETYRYIPFYVWWFNRVDMIKQHTVWSQINLALNPNSSLRHHVHFPLSSKAVIKIK